AGSAAGRAPALEEREAQNATPATSRFSNAAAITVPGSPTQPTSQNPLSSPPAAAPRLLGKYRRARARPRARGARRTKAAPISGEVAPSSRDWGRSSRTASAHWTSGTPAVPPSAGNQ